MTVRSRPLGSGFYTIPGGGFSTLYTVPADRTAILKDLRLTTFAALGVTSYVHVYNGATLMGTVMRLAAALPAGIYLPPGEVWVAMTEGWELRLYAGVGEGFSVSASGSLLAGDPA